MTSKSVCFMFEHVEMGFVHVDKMGLLLDAFKTFRNRNLICVCVCVYVCVCAQFFIIR